MRVPVSEWNEWNVFDGGMEKEGVVWESSARRDFGNGTVWLLKSSYHHINKGITHALGTGENGDKNGESKECWNDWAEQPEYYPIMLFTNFLLPLFSG